MHENNSNTIYLLAQLVQRNFLFNFIQSMCTKLTDLAE